MATKQIGSNKWQAKQSATAAAFSPYKPFKNQIDGAVREDGRGVVLASWAALRGVVRATVNADAPKWGGMDDSALGKRIGMKNIAWAHVADTWGVNLGGVSFLLDRDDPHYAAVRASALAFRSAVTGTVSLGYNPVAASGPLFGTESKIKAALAMVAE